MRRGDRQGVARRDKKEVEGEERKGGGGDRGIETKSESANDHGEQEDHRKIGKLGDALEQLAGDDTDGHSTGCAQSAHPEGACLRNGWQPAARHGRLIRRDDRDRDAHCVRNDGVGEGRAEQAAERSRRTVADDDLGDVVALRVGKDLGREVPRIDANRRGTQPLREPHRLINTAQLCPVRGFALALGEVDCDPVRFQGGRHAGGRTHDLLRMLVASDTDEKPLGGWPRAVDAALAQLREHLLVDAIRRAPECQLAQCSERAQLEELVEGAPYVLGDVDLSVPKTLQQLFGREIDHDDLIGPFEYPVGDRLAHRDPGNALDDVRQTFEMLDVECGPDIDTRLQHAIHVLVALRMDETRRIRVGELVDQQQLRPPRDGGIDVELHECAIAVRDCLAREYLESVEESRRLRTSVRFDDTHDHVNTLGLQRARGGQHGVGLADTGRHAEKNLELAARILRGKLEQCLW